MMYCKAFFFHNPSTAKRIISTSSMKEQKALWRTVKGFNDHEWSLIRQKVGEEGNYAKFTQDERMKTVLLGTGEKMLCEASKTKNSNCNVECPRCTSGRELGTESVGEGDYGCERGF